MGSSLAIFLVLAVPCILGWGAAGSALALCVSSLAALAVLSVQVQRVLDGERGARPVAVSAG